MFTFAKILYTDYKYNSLMVDSIVTNQMVYARFVGGIPAGWTEITEDIFSQVYKITEEKE